MSDADRLAEIRQRAEGALPQIGTTRGRNMAAIVCQYDIPFLLAQLEARDREIEELKREAIADEERVADAQRGAIDEGDERRLADEDNERLTRENESLRSCLRELRGVADILCGRAATEAQTRADALLAGDEDPQGCTVDIGMEVTPSGQSKHVWLRPQDVRGYVEDLRARLEAAEAILRDALPYISHGNYDEQAIRVRIEAALKGRAL